MATTNFTAGTVVASSWLNDVDDIVYRKAATVLYLTDPAFGGVGDGVTDNTAAFNAAIAALPTYGGILFIPYGIYLHNSAITCSKRIVMIGAGTYYQNGASQTEILKGAGVSGAGWTFTGEGSIIEKIGFRGAVGNTGDGVVLAGSRMTVRDCGFFRFGQDGLRVGTDSGGENCNLFCLDNVKTELNGRDGIRISEGAGPLADANAGTIINLDTKSNTGAGLYFGGSQLGTVVGGAYQSNGTYGIHFGPDAKYHCVFGGDLEANTTAQCRLDTGAEFNTIHNQTLSLADFSIGATTANNRLDIQDHNRLISGIKFPPTQLASTDVNTLDDYEEGTFTPVVIGTSTAGVGTYSVQSGAYTKIGQIVHFQISITWSAHTGTGNTEVGELPFTSKTTASGLYPVTIIQSGGPAPGAGSTRTAHVPSNSTRIALREQVQATAVLNNSNAITGTGSLYISGTYVVA